MLSMENLPQQNWKHWNMFKWPEQEATVSSAPSLSCSDFPWVVWPFPWALRWEWGIGLLWVKQTEKAKRCKCTAGWSSPPLLFICAQLADCGEESNSPGISPVLKLARPLPSQALAARHMETLNRSSSTDFLLLLVYSEHSPFHSLDIKTYGSHYLQIGSKERRRPKKKRGRDRILQIVSSQNIRWGGTGLMKRWVGVIPMETSIMGRMSHIVHLSLRGWEEEWSSFLLNYWSELLKKLFRDHQQIKRNKHLSANVNPGHTYTHTLRPETCRWRAPVYQSCDQVYDVGEWLLHIECYRFYMLLTLNRPANTFAGLHKGNTMSLAWWLFIIMYVKI